jgi:hypothetical protein
LAALCGAAALLATTTTCGLARNDDELDPEGEGDSNAAKLVSLTLKPNNDILLVDLNPEASKTFTERTLFSNGSSADFTRKMKWSMDNNTVGKFQGATFKSAVLSQSKVDFTRVFAKIKTADRELATVANLTIVWLRTTGNSQDFFFSLP